MPRSQILVVLAAATALVLCCKSSDTANSQSHQTLTSTAQLRAAFNADSGKVRAIFLASPT
jgi:hypothetical protein